MLHKIMAPPSLSLYRIVKYCGVGGGGGIGGRQNPTKGNARPPLCLSDS